MSKEEILGGIFDYTTWFNKSPDLLNGIRKAMDEYAAQKDAEISRLQQRVKELEGSISAAKTAIMNYGFDKADPLIAIAGVERILSQSLKNKPNDEMVMA